MRGDESYTAGVNGDNTNRKSALNGFAAFCNMAGKSARGYTELILQCAAKNTQAYLFGRRHTSVEYINLPSYQQYARFLT